MQIFIAYANLNDSESWQALSQKALPTYVCLPNSPNKYQQKRYQQRKLAYTLLWQLGKSRTDFRQYFSKIFLDKWGRPQIPSSKWDFNISHSGDWVAVVLCESENKKTPCIAIDIEFPKKPRPYSALLKAFGSQKEQQWLSEQPLPEQAFYQAWCLREAVLKATGIGLRKLTQVKVDHQKCTITCPNTPTGKGYFFCHLPFYLALYHAHDAPISIQVFTHSTKQDTLNFHHCYQVNGKAL